MPRACELGSARCPLSRRRSCRTERCCEHGKANSGSQRPVCAEVLFRPRSGSQAATQLLNRAFDNVGMDGSNSPVTDVRPKCFVAMPLSTTQEVANLYGGDSDHFVHVLDYLFAPAVDKAGYDLVKPIMSGADLIQAEIIKHLETADLVLCDISRHNPNVFFELGVRTSLDRPVALVRDSNTDRLPFDTGILNTHTYHAQLDPWRLAGEIDSLANHIRLSAERSNGTNPMWNYFGLTQRAKPQPLDGDPVEAKLDLLLTEMRGRLRESSVDGEAKRRRSRATVFGEYLPTTTSAGTLPSEASAEQQQLLLRLAQAADEINARVKLVSISATQIDLDANPFGITPDEWEKMSTIARESGYELTVTDDGQVWSTTSGDADFF